LVAGTSAKEDELTELCLHRDEQAEDLQKMEAAGKQLRGEVELLRQEVEANRRVSERMQEAEKRQAELEAEMHELSRSAEQYHQAVRLKAEAENAIRRAEELQAEGERLNEKKAKIQTEREQMLTEHRNRSEAVAFEERRIQAAKGEIDAKIGETRAKKAGFLAKIDQIDAFLDKTVECPNCGHTFVPGAEEQRKQLEILQKQVWELDFQLQEQESASGDLQRKIAGLKYPPEPDLPGFGDIETKLASASEELSGCNSWRPILQRAQEAQVRLEEMEKRRQQIKSEQDRLEVEIEDLRKQLDPEVQLRFDRKQEELAEAQDAYHAVSKTLSALEAQIGALEKQIDELGQKAGELLQLKIKVEEQERHASEWRWLERACGPDGIQALELDAMGPGIAAVANRLLQAAYGSRFQVEFRTTRIGGQGSKRKQIEDFQIWILDSEDGSEQQLETLSGGEQVWVKRAVCDAFGIIRDQSTGQRFLTVFQDEADGALDPEARLAYFRMLEAAHQESGRHHTVVITHSQEAQEMIPQQIRLEDLKVQVPA
jgi:exonuclease SbcC